MLGEHKDRPGGWGGCSGISRGMKRVRDEAREEGGQVQESQKCLLSFFSKMGGSRRILSRGLDFFKKDHSGCWVEDKGQEQVQQQLVQVRRRCIAPGCRGGGEQQQDSENMSRILLLQFGCESDVGYERKRGVKDDFKVVGLSNWKSREPGVNMLGWRCGDTSSLPDKLSLRCLVDSRAEMSKGQLDVCVWSQRGRSGLEK